MGTTKQLVLAAIVVITAPGAALAEAAQPWEAGCLVTGLDPNGDGFLSIRTGPGTGHREIARVRNGDALFLDTRECRGKWCLAEGGAVNGRQTDLRGWFYTAWCEFYP
jgi:hypothetical protein